MYLKVLSDEGYFPKLFSKITSKDAPVVGMVTITIIQSFLSLMTISPSLSEQFETLVNLAVVTNIIPYLLSMGAIIVLMKATGRSGGELKGQPLSLSLAPFKLICAICIRS